MVIDINIIKKTPTIRLPFNAKIWQEKGHILKSLSKK